MTYTLVWYIIGIVSLSPSHFHSEKIGLIRVTYDPPVSYRVKYISLSLSWSSHTGFTIFTLQNFCKPFYKKEGGGCFSKNVYRMFIKIECNDYVYCQRTVIGLLGSRDIVKESLEFKPNTNFAVVANKIHNC